MKPCVCTIVSANYLGYAKTLMASMQETNPEFDRKVLLVDKVNGRFDPDAFNFELIEADSIGIDGFEEMAFRFGIMEMNTNVKPFFMNWILGKGYSSVVYLDPDIVVFKKLSELRKILDAHSVVVTPHINNPISDRKRPNEQDHLLNGVFNLGFVAVSNCSEGIDFLNWWGSRCFELGFDDLRSGLFVDQKWIDYVPCFFPNHYVLRKPGYNVAYWNLQERHLENQNGNWLVNGEDLVFFHFSGFPSEAIETISKHQDRFNTTTFPSVLPLLQRYKMALQASGHQEYKAYSYTYATYSNGELISKVARRYYSISEYYCNGENPFDEASGFYSWAKRKGIHKSQRGASDYNYRTMNAKDIRVTILNCLFKFSRRLLGADRYFLFMKYVGYFSVLRHQKEML